MHSLSIGWESCSPNTHLLMCLDAHMHTYTLAYAHTHLRCVSVYMVPTGESVTWWITLHHTFEKDMLVIPPCWHGNYATMEDTEPCLMYLCVGEYPDGPCMVDGWQIYTDTESWKQSQQTQASCGSTAPPWCSAGVQRVHLGLRCEDTSLPMSSLVDSVWPSRMFILRLTWVGWGWVEDGVGWRGQGRLAVLYLGASWKMIAR